VNHVEFIDVDEEFTSPPIVRWIFAGSAQFTVLALSSAQRDQLFDEVVKVIAFAKVNPSRSAFRTTIESGEYIGMDANWDNVTIMGMAETPGTPWGTDDYLYEATIALTVQGEFVSEAEGGNYVKLSRIDVYHNVVDLEPETTPPGTGDWQ
jgi:hypothetical protein